MIKAVELAEQVMVEDAVDLYVNLGQSLMSFIVQGSDVGLDGLERTIDLSPNYATAHFDLARTRVMAGQFESGRKSLDLSLRLNPIDPYKQTALATQVLLAFGEADEETAIRRTGPRACPRSAITT